MEKQGFTLIEFIVILLILAFLGAVAVPAYQNVANQMRAAAVRAALDEIRAAIRTYQANDRLKGGGGALPGIQEVAHPSQNQSGGACPDNHILEDCEVPSNPFAVIHWRQNYDPNTTSPFPNQVRETMTDPIGTIIDPSPPSGTYTGWVYHSDTGEFWANSNVMGENNW